ncbi:MAG: pentapeptide repeat-containing protein [Patescibacteria group bacterium]|nr:pentapeptide repeat-containing protein [Patescibacteria group bacterium]
MMAKWREKDPWIEEQLKLHSEWLADNQKGKRADLSGSRLSAYDFRNRDLRQVNFFYAILVGCDFRGANVLGANFRSAALSGADFRGAIGLPTAPVIPNLDRRILRAIGSKKPRLGTGKGKRLEMYTYHTCDTTHCRAGWAIHLAGKAGLELEEKYGSDAAGAFIYATSRHDMPVPDFYASNEDALADIVKCAAQEGR